MHGPVNVKIPSYYPYFHVSEMRHPRCVYKLIGGGIKSVTQQV